MKQNCDSLRGVGTCETGIRGIVVDGLARDVQAQSALVMVSPVRLNESCRELTMVAPMPTIKALTIVRAILRGEEK